MDYKLVLQKLLTDPKLWTAIIGLLNAIILYAVPTFPKEILAGLNAIVVVIAGAFTGVQIVSVARLSARNKQL